MRYLNIITVALISIILFSNVAFAESINVVDIEKVIQNYSKAEEARTSLKKQEDEIQKFVEDAKKALQAEKNPDKQKKLEDKYNKDLKLKKDNYFKAKSQLVDDIQSNISKSVETIAKKKNINTIFKKDSILYGGEDLTSEIISELNKKK